MNRFATEFLAPDEAGLARAADLLGSGELVAFPTETVYGLGADARNGAAVAKIYEAKGRPRFNPLIAHMADLDMARSYVEVSDLAARLAEAFWPGPLTLVLPHRTGSEIADMVTAGLDTLAVRVPELPLARQLLVNFGGPLAAPSANPSGRVSATTAEHVLQGLDGKIAAVLDGGACPVGVESTILGVGEDVTILRHGGLPIEAIEACIGAQVDRTDIATDRPTAPGQLASHYAPNATLRLNATVARPGEFLIGFGRVKGDVSLSPSGDLSEAATALFGTLRLLDDQAIENAAVAPIPVNGLGAAINDRLKRAAAPRP